MPDFESNLKKYRQLAGLTQEELAQRVGVRRETIVRLEVAKYNPPSSWQWTSAGRWGAPIEEIFVFES